MVDHSFHSKSGLSDNRAFNAAGRFDSEYVSLKKLGRGGFSSVYMVRNLLDDSLSAVKKVVIKVNAQNKLNIQNEVKSALQEIRTLANIKSENVVVYKHSWIEVKLKVK
jgi:serine/threonine protein kinase